MTEATELFYLGLFLGPMVSMLTSSKEVDLAEMRLYRSCNGIKSFSPIYDTVLWELLTEDKKLSVSTNNYNPCCFISGTVILHSVTAINSYVFWEYVYINSPIFP